MRIGDAAVVAASMRDHGAWFFRIKLIARLQLGFGLLQARRIDPRLVRQHFGDLAIGANGEFTATLFIGWQYLVAELDTTVAYEHAQARDKPANLILALAEKGAAPWPALLASSESRRLNIWPSVRIP